MSFQFFSDGLLFLLVILILEVAVFITTTVLLFRVILMTGFSFDLFTSFDISDRNSSAVCLPILCLYFSELLINNSNLYYVIRLAEVIV
jgi:hypothetical protein